jgi:hypothetical protein
LAYAGHRPDQPYQDDGCDGVAEPGMDQPGLAADRQARSIKRAWHDRANASHQS